jgi:Ca2+-binding EF-hand superfamily protein
MSSLLFITILGTDAEDILMHAFKTFDADAKGFLHRDK